MTLKHALMAAATAMTAFGVAGVAPASAEPVLIKQVPPEYPRGAERRKLEGTVDVAFEVSDSGEVQNITVVAESMPGVFDKAAIEAVEQWKFEQGNPGKGEITIAFAL
ncbi:MAG: TonB family protein [Ponticaulis sp.]|nr:TonB family protein [Ponticaulis sp.]